MDKKKRSKLPYIMIVVLGTAIAGLLLYILPNRYRLNQTTVYEESDREVGNPLIGFAPPAEDTEACEETELVYIGITWAEWEPRQGDYAIEEIEEKYHIKRWKDENKHAVLRFVCDVPGEEEHKDIPEWLYQSTRDGSFYHTEYGKGYSPEYSNKFFKERHRLAVEALADYCNQDSFVAYVELGSLGHWGEWHTNTEEGVTGLPGPEECWEYVLDYSNSFNRARLLMRRNYVMVSDAGLGLYNDMVGSESDTERWLGWIENGGSFETESGELEYVPVPDFWKKAPCGGELTSIYPVEELLDERLAETSAMIREAHMSFLGPKCPTGETMKSQVARAMEKSLGYRFYISALETRFSFGDNVLEVTLTWENTGNAPLYWDWPVMMYVYNQEGEVKYWQSVDMKLSELMPGESMKANAQIPFNDMFREGYQIGIQISNPEEEEYIELAMECEQKDGVQIIYTYDK